MTLKRGVKRLMAMKPDLLWPHQNGDGVARRHAGISWRNFVGIGPFVSCIVDVAGGAMACVGRHWPVVMNGRYKARRPRSSSARLYVAGMKIMSAKPGSAGMPR